MQYNLKIKLYGKKNLFIQSIKLREILLIGNYITYMVKNFHSTIGN